MRSDRVSAASSILGSIGSPLAPFGRRVRRSLPTWQTSLVGAVAVAVVIVALNVDGFRSAKLNLDDGGVWITNSARQRAGRVNTQIGQMDAVSPTVSVSLDVLQHGRTVLLVDPDGGSVSVLDAAAITKGASVELPAGTETSMGGSQIVLHAPDGRLWLRTPDDLGSFDQAETKPTLRTGKDAAIAVGVDGGVAVADPGAGTITHIGGRAGGTEAPSIPLAVSGTDLQAAIFGDTVAVLANGADAALQVGERTIDLGAFGAHPVLGRSSANGRVLVATDTHLLSFATDGDDEPTVLWKKGTGAPVVPVDVAGCVYGAWSTSPTEVILCDGATPSSGPLDLPGGTALKFRVNGARVVLNAWKSGEAFLARDGQFVRVDNWDDVIPQTDITQTTDPNNNSPGDDDNCSRGEVNGPPTATDDQAGARPGVATIIPVLANDKDPECDVMTVTEVRAMAPPDAGVIDIVDRGQALQFTSSPGFTGEVTFDYLLSDGWNPVVLGHATVVVKGFDAPNGKPVQKKGGSRASVGAGSKVSYNVLNDFVDPDGDPLVLDSVTMQDGDTGTLRSTTDGTVTYADAGSIAGERRVILQVSDGRDTVAGELTIKVQDELDPVARNDHATGVIGQRIDIPVLANDTGSNSEPPLLASAGDATGGIVEPDLTGGIVAFTASEAGTFHFHYLITAGGKTAEGWVRVDVVEAGENEPPVAVRDQLTVAVGGSGVIDIVSNDSDPDGDVLVVTSISPPVGSGLTVALLEHRALRVSASRLESAPVTISYILSDGLLTDEGQVVVQTIASSIVNQPPTAVDDVAVVRSGDVVAIPVLANDTDPDGDHLTLSRSLTWNTPEGAPTIGDAFVDGDVVRFVAGPQPGYATLSYSVTDAVGQTSSAVVRIDVSGLDGPNQPPTPRSVEARAFAGSAVTIRIPTAGIDPDGDSVTLRLDVPPKQGTVAQADPTACGCFVFEALAAARGGDSFTYVATDPFGGSGIGVVRIGIAERPAVNLPPTVVDDEVQVRPGRTVRVDALSNDSDPDGDAIQIDERSELAPDHGATAKLRSGGIAVTAGDDVGVATFGYTVVDARAATATGYVTANISETAPLLPPIAHDDPAPDVKAGDLAVDIDVLDNDEDPDGSVADLEVSLFPSAPTDVKVRNGTSLRATLGDRPRVVAYTITDPDGLSASAVAHIPARLGGTSKVNRPPELTGVRSYDVVDGTPLEIDVAKVVSDPEGAPVIITEESKLRGISGTLEWTGATTLRFTSTPKYSGPGSISFEVTDGKDSADPDGAKATFTLDLAITGENNTPPTLTAPVVEVGIGDDDKTVELRPFAVDPDPGDKERLEFAVVSEPGGGVKASLDGSTLHVSAGDGATKGDRRQLSLTVADPKNPAVASTLQINVVASTRPKAKANDDVVEDATSGKPVEVAVLSNDKAPERLDPLTVTGVEVPPGLGTATFGASSVTFTPDPKWDGTASLRYTVNDRLGDPDRAVTGSITVTVRNRPDAPDAPTVTEYGSRLVVLTWAAPRNHGGLIDKYEVSAVDGSIPSKDCGPATTCRLGDLKNGHEYEFKVRAHNAVGWSDLGPASAKVTPDVRPNKPSAAPMLAFEKGLASGELKATWTEPVNEGTPIINYELELSPYPVGGQPILMDPGTRSATLGGMVDGTGYRLRYRARNSFHDEPFSDDGTGWSQWSEFSAPETPATTPAAPAKPAASRVDSPTGGQVRVQWSAPSNGGAPISQYTVQMYDTAAPSVVARTIPVTDGSNQIVAATTPNHDYRFTVAATNKAGDSAASPMSDVVHDYQKPDKPQTPRAFAAGQSGSLSVSGTTLAYMEWVGNGGQSITKFELEVSPGSVQTWSPQVEAEWDVLGLTNGTQYTFRVRAFNGYWSDWSDRSPPESPYGPPAAPSVSAAHIGNNTIRLTWNPPAANGRAVDAMQISINGDSWSNVPLSDHQDIATGYSTTISIRARAASSGQWGDPSGAASARTPDPPAREVSVFPGGRNPTSSGTCPANRCRIVGVSLRNFFPANSTHSVNCDWGPTYGIAAVTVTVDGNGNGDVLTNCYLGNDNVSAIVDGQSWGPWFMSWWDT